MLRSCLQIQKIGNDNNPLKITVTGKGSGRLNMELRWNRKAADDEICPFNLESPDLSHVNLKFAGNSQHRHFVAEEYVFAQYFDFVSFI